MNGLVEFIQKWSEQIRYLADICIWVADSFDRFPKKKQRTAGHGNTGSAETGHQQPNRAAA